MDGWHALLVLVCAGVAFLHENAILYLTVISRILEWHTWMGSHRDELSSPPKRHGSPGGSPLEGYLSKVSVMDPSVTTYDMTTSHDTIHSRMSGP